jgi:KaiC/GvpD/RAD55 family RecA-like ATPase
VIAERPDYIVGGHVLQGRYDENFLADGVLHLRLHPISDVDMQRRVRIVKMRGTKHEMGYLALHVDRGQFEAARALGG